MKSDIEFIPYGGISSRLTKSHRGEPVRQSRISASGPGTRHGSRRVFVTFSQDLDESFVEVFRNKATQNAHLLIVNEGLSTDRLMSRLVDLKIRTSQRFCVIDTSVGFETVKFTAFVQSILKRLSSAHQAEDQLERILDVKADEGLLHVVSTNFSRLDVPIAQIPELAGQDSARVREFEIDEDGAFIYWPALDLHLGWTQLYQLVNPEAALKASQKTRAFRRRQLLRPRRPGGSPAK